MSDGEASKSEAPKLASLDVSDWQRILSALLDGHQCPVCAGDLWEIAAAEDKLVVTGLHYLSWPAGAPYGFTQCIPAICDACGYVEMFEAEKLERWWQRREARGQ